MKMKRKPLLIGAAILVVVAVVSGMALRGHGSKTPEVQTAKVVRQKIVQRVNGTGKIQPKTQVEISADVSAKITRLPVVEGQWVEKGALLVELARERYVAAVESAVASVSSAEANASLVSENMSRAENEYKRSKELLAGKLESQASFEAKQAEYRVEVARHKSATDQVQQAQAALKQARDDLSKTTIYAPMSGTISALKKEQGEIALGSQFQKDVILVVADLRSMEAQVNVDENDIMSVAIGQPAEIEVDALPNQRLKGVVSEIASSANSAGAGTSEQKTEFEIKISIIDPPKTLRPGMTASADIITKTNENALSVPLQSVAVRTVDQLALKGEKRKEAEARYKADRDGFVEIVFCIDNGRAVARQVKTGIQSDELIEILDGLKEGDEIVTGSYRAISKDLENGAQVTINNSKKPSDRAKGSGAPTG
ncbi:MAG: efflux RND transporter periplasmic adaptor subunit [Candidatus Eisenbacteria bacterium]|uniref:Efflux RND transporter periplasmic adaptor subunit n=1 Tax=Eiseniibacteriota bacterium TaxID=2212470 RepID=A0A538T799_UNCEI|nr:MAG: efflux RND transporter periplasmic adaptor subunit [Candidatus Eisenbacteria bacterium]